MKLFSRFAALTLGLSALLVVATTADLQPSDAAAATAAAMDTTPTSLQEDPAMVERELFFGKKKKKKKAKPAKKKKAKPAKKKKKAKPAKKKKKAPKPVTKTVGKKVISKPMMGKMKISGKKGIKKTAKKPAMMVMTKTVVDPAKKAEKQKKKAAKKAEKQKKKAEKMETKSEKKAEKKEKKEEKKAEKKEKKKAKKMGMAGDKAKDILDKAKKDAKKAGDKKKKDSEAKKKDKDIPAVTGDPHFVMWSGQKYDFHGGCDLVLVQNPNFNNGQGLYIHIRTKIIRWWSYVDSVAVQIGEDTLEVMGGVENKRYFVNAEQGTDKLGSSHMMNFTIGGYDVRYRGLNEHQFQFKIFLHDDQDIVLKAVKDFMRVDIENPTVESFEESVGLMGSFSGGQMLSRTGEVMTDPNEFGMEWQVQHTEPMLFHNVEGTQHPEACAMPKITQDSRRRLEGSISREQAELACAKVSPDSMKDCVYDVMATNDVEMAGAF